MTPPISDRERELWNQRVLAEASRKFIAMTKTKVISADYTVTSKYNTIIIGTATANAADVTLPDPTKWKNRPITILNYSGNSQNVLSHAGTTLKVASTAAVGTHALENASTATTGKRIFISDGTNWYMSI